MPIIAAQSTAETPFRVATIAAIHSLLFDRNFAADDALCDGVVELIDALCDYTEEGRHLYPQILLTNSLDSALKGIPFLKTLILETALPSIHLFKAALKRAAPLATGGWSIFLEYEPHQCRYGLVSVEASMLSASLESNLIVPQPEVVGTNRCFALIKNVGERLVQIKSQNAKIYVDFSLRSIGLNNDAALDALISAILKDVPDEARSNIQNFVVRMLDMAFPFSHGNLVGVVKSEPLLDEYITKEANRLWRESGEPAGLELDHWLEASVQPLTRVRKIAKGMFLPSPIDLQSIIDDNGDKGSDTTMRSYAGLVRNMLNNDGITIFDTKGQVMGYHVFIDSKADAPNERQGGARTRAFEAMVLSGLFEACFFKSQDGLMKVWCK